MRTDEVEDVCETRDIGFRLAVSSDEGGHANGSRHDEPGTGRVLPQLLEELEEVVRVSRGNCVRRITLLARVLPTEERELE